MTPSVLLKFNFRYYRRHSLLPLLCLLGISLGVGIVIAVELINASALRSFSSTVDFLAGKATHSVVSGYGQLDEKLFFSVWTNPAITAANPVVEAVATCVETGEEPLRFIGVDPFLDSEVRGLAPKSEGEARLVEFLASDPPSAYVTADLTHKHGLKQGSILNVLTAGVARKLVVTGNLPREAEAGLGGGTVVMDIAAAQETFGRVGYLDRIDIVSSSTSEQLQQSLPRGLRLVDSDSRKSTLAAMLYSFQLNLAAMSMLAVFVGVFLIYNFSMFSVLSRRQDMSLLLTLGADQRSLVIAFMTESLLFAAAGSLLGIMFGYAVAWLSITKVSGTISELYFHVNVRRVQLGWAVMSTGFVVGFVATILGTLLPALEVAVTPPVLGMKRRSIEDRAHAVKGLLVYSGFACFVGALICAWLSRFSIFWGFVSAFAMTLAFALFTPGFLSRFTHHLGAIFRRTMRSPAAFLSARTIRASLSRTSIAVAALAVALSMTVGVDTMIHSFRQSVAEWLEGSLQGDLYISPGTTKWNHPLPEALLAMFPNDQRIASVERYSAYDMILNDRPVKIRVVDGQVLEHRSSFHFLKGGAGAWLALRNGGIFISESLAYRFGLDVGNEVSLSTPDGTRAFRVVSVVRDYSSDQGAFHMDREVYERYWKDPRVQSVALFLKPGASVDGVRADILARYPGLGPYMVSSSRMKVDILHIFDKTFAPTATLKGVSLMVALLGVATALTAILMERSREMRMMGYLGLMPGEMARMNVYQGMVMGLAAFLVAAVCGTILSYIIVFAINYRSFGWSVDMHLDPLVYGRTFALTAVACLAAALYPTYRQMAGTAAAAPEDE